MSEQTAVRTNTSRAALVAGLGLLGFFVAQQVVSAFVSTVQTAAMTGFGDVDPQRWVFGALSVATTTLPIALMAALSFGRLAPIHADLRLGQVLTRGAVAAALGAALVLLVQIVVPILISPPTSSAMSGLYDAQLAGGLIVSVFGHVMTFVVYLSPVVLAAVLLWLWHRRRIPADAD